MIDTENSATAERHLGDVRTVSEERDLDIGPRDGTNVDRTRASQDE